MSHSLPMTHTVLLVSNIAPPALITHAKMKTPEVQTFRFFYSSHRSKKVSMTPMVISDLHSGFGNRLKTAGHF